MNSSPDPTDATGELEALRGRVRELQAENAVLRRTLESGAASDARRDHRLLEETAATTRVGGWELDASTGVLFWTAETYRLHDSSPAEYTPTVETAVAFYAPESRPVIASAVQRSIADGTPWDLQLELVTARGRRVQVRTTGRAERVDGRTARIFGTFQDVTERVRAEAERIRWERDLLHTQKLESLGVLASGVADDFNDLLTSILGYADLVEADLPPAAVCRAHLQGVKGTARQAAGLCQQLLAYAGKTPLRSTPVDLSQLVGKTTELLHFSVLKKAVLQLDLEPDLPRVLADAAQLQQVVMNLVLNAAESLQSKEGVVHVATGVRFVDPQEADGRTPGPHVFFEVRDSGVGMSDEVRARIFEPFFTTKPNARGLGLAAVQGIVRGHAGTLTVESRPGIGSCFTVLLPALEVEVESRPVRPAALTIGGGGSIVVADDDEAIRTISAIILRTLGFRVELAADGREAVDLCNRHGDDVVLVLLDLNMPRMNGLEALAQIHCLRPQLGVLLMSGYTTDEEGLRSALEVAAGFLQKPFTREDLIAKVCAALAAPPR